MQELPPHHRCIGWLYIFLKCLPSLYLDICRMLALRNESGPTQLFFSTKRGSADAIFLLHGDCWTLFRGLILNLQQQDFPQSARLVIHRAYSVLCTSQGCPLSPFLFMILMTVLFTDREDTECPTMVFLPTQINLPKMCNGKLVNW